MYQQPKVEKKKEDKIKYSNFPLTRINFVLMAICGAMILIGIFADAISAAEIIFSDQSLAFLSASS